MASNTSSSNPLWDLQAQYLPGTFQAATDIYNQGAPGYYPGQTVADFDPVKAQGLNLGVDAALGAQTDLANTYATQLGGIAGGTDAYTQQLANQAAGATNFGYGQAGTLGSARHANAASQAAANTIADRQLSALSQIPQAQAAATLPGQTLTSIGNTTQDYAQDLINADKDRYNYEANLPYNWLNQYQSALAPGGINAPTSSSTKETGTSGIASSIGDIANIAGSIGTIAGLFSDERLKSNVNKVDSYAEGGKVDGPSLYSYNNHAYGGRPEVGVMAQEVAQTDPDLVSRHPTGLLKVNYDGLADRYPKTEGLPASPPRDDYFLGGSVILGDLLPAAFGQGTWLSGLKDKSEAETGTSESSNNATLQDWHPPTSNFGWQEVDGRPQLVSQPRSPVPGSTVSNGYTPKQIGYDGTGATTLMSGGGSQPGGYRGPSQVALPDGTSIAVDSQLEYNNAIDIAKTIKEGGINPKTGDYNIIAGPHALSFADEGFFGFGADYNKEFQDNFNAQLSHSNNNPTGQTTGTPIFNQGYASDDNFIANILNNSTIGQVGSLLTGNNLVPTYDDLLPPTSGSSGSSSSSFISGGGSDGVGNWGAVGDFFGGIGDSLGITNYSGDNDDSSSNDSSSSSDSSSDSGGGWFSDWSWSDEKLKSNVNKVESYARGGQVEYDMRTAFDKWFGR